MRIRLRCSNFNTGERLGALATYVRPHAPSLHPVFYLKRWAGADGKLCEYSRPHGETAKGLRKAPKSTAFVRDLYTIPGAPPEAAQFVEKRFMKLTDDWA